MVVHYDTPYWPYVSSAKNVKDERHGCSASLWGVIIGARLTYSCKSKHVLIPAPFPRLSSQAQFQLWSLQLCYQQGSLCGTDRTKELGRTHN